MTRGSNCCTAPTSGNQDEGAEGQQRSSGTPGRTSCEQAQRQSCHTTFDRNYCSECSERTQTPHRKQAVFVSPRQHCRQKPAPHEALRFAKKRFATCPVSSSLLTGSTSCTSAAGMSGSHSVERERHRLQSLISLMCTLMTNFCSAPAGILQVFYCTKPRRGSRD